MRSRSVALFVAISLLAALPAIPQPSPTPVQCDITFCTSLAGNSNCDNGFACVHSAEVDCGIIAATVVYDTSCQSLGGPFSTTKVQQVLKTGSASVTNRCQCELTPSLGQTWGDICCMGDCCACFDLTCN